MAFPLELDSSGGSGDDLERASPARFCPLAG